MKTSLHLIVMAGALALVAPSPAWAQVAAEEAIILSGGSGQASAQKRLDDAISGGFDAATGALRASGPAASAANGRSRGSGYTEPLPQGDPLDNTDARAYQVQGGARIRVSGSFRPSRTTSCTLNCEPAPDEQAPAVEEPAPE